MRNMEGSTSSQMEEKGMWDRVSRRKVRENEKRGKEGEGIHGTKSHSDC